MGVFFIYILKSSVCLVLFYLFFRLLLSKETFHRFNRMALLGVLFFSLLIPCIEVTTRHQVEVQQAVLSIEQLLLMAELEATPANVGAVQETSAISWVQVVLLVYLAGILFLACRNIYSLICLFRLIHSGKHEKLEKGVTLVVHNQEIAPFSWMKYIVISRKDLEENGREILIHEMAHIHHRHSVDLLVADICIFFQWFNPSAWLLKQELQNVHEYEADELTINKGIDATQYQLLLVKKAVGAKRFQLANGFNHSKLKNRITMMHKNKTNKWMRLAYFLCIPVLIVAMGACAQKTNAGNISNPDALSIAGDKASTDTLQSEVVPFQFADIKPSFNGGDANKFSKWVNENLNYPENCKKEGICGRVTLTFTVTETGKVTDVKILRGVHEDLDKEALRVVSSSPDWTPGMKNGKPVPITFTFPVIFQTKKPEKDAQ